MESVARRGAGAIQGFDEEEEDLGGHGVVEVRGVGEGGVAAAVEDGLQGLDEGAELGGEGEVGVGGDLLEEGGGSGGTASGKVLGHVEEEPPEPLWFSPPSRR